jgi:cell division protease FtsH
MSKALLESETIDSDQIEDIMSGRPPRPPKPSSSQSSAPPMEEPPTPAPAAGSTTAQGA